jgi:hypothetical protein
MHWKRVKANDNKIQVILAAVNKISLYEIWKFEFLDVRFTILAYITRTSLIWACTDPLMTNI